MLGVVDDVIILANVFRLKKEIKAHLTTWPTKPDCCMSRRNGHGRDHDHELLMIT